MFEIEHISYIQNELLPKVKEFQNRLTDFMESNEEVKQCVRNFDESISMKANKC